MSTTVTGTISGLISQIALVVIRSRDRHSNKHILGSRLPWVIRKAFWQVARCQYGPGGSLAKRLKTSGRPCMGAISEGTQGTVRGPGAQAGDAGWFGCSGVRKR